MPDILWFFDFLQQSTIFYALKTRTIAHEQVTRSCAVYAKSPLITWASARSNAQTNPNFLSCQYHHPSSHNDFHYLHISSIFVHYWWLRGVHCALFLHWSGSTRLTNSSYGCFLVAYEWIVWYPRSRYGIFTFIVPWNFRCKASVIAGKSWGLRGRFKVNIASSINSYKYLVCSGAHLRRGLTWPCCTTIGGLNREGGWIWTPARWLAGKSNR
jgi:hypothetical protein